MLLRNLTAATILLAGLVATAGGQSMPGPSQAEALASEYQRPVQAGWTQYYQAQIPERHQVHNSPPSGATIPEISSTSYYDQQPGDSPSDAIEAPEVPGDEADKGCGCAADCGGCGCEKCGCSRFCNKADEPWTLQGWLQPCNDCPTFTYGGWINFGATVNGDGVTTGTANFPNQFNIQSDTPVMNQLWFYVDREADTGGCGWDFGYHFDVVWGTDGPDTQAFGDTGWDNGWDSGRDYGGAVPQLYLDVAYNDLTVRFGHFYTIIGYEVVQAPDNFFYSHAYTMFYAEPFTHTGILASYPLNDQVEISAGWTQGWDSGFNNANDADMFLGSIGWTSCDEAMSLVYAVSAGRFGDGTVGNNGELYMHSIVFSYEFGCDWTYVLQSDLADNGNATGPGTLSAQWGGVNQYLFKELNDCWALGFRLEWFRDDDGARIVGPGASTSADYYEFTAGLNWTPTANIKVRPELRYDWARGGATPFNSGTPAGLAAQSSDLFTFAIDCILTF